MRKLLIASVLVLSLVFMPFVAQWQKVHINAHALTIKNPSEIIDVISIDKELSLESDINFKRYIPTLDDDFADNRIIVTLKQKYSDINQAIDFKSFEEASTKVVEKLSTERISNSVMSDVSLSKRHTIESAKDLTYIEDASVIKSPEIFSQIISLELNENCKENVLKTIEELEKLDHVLAAEPDYNFIAEDDTTDTLYNLQWGLKGTGTNGTHIESAWSVTNNNYGTTNPRTKVGII